ncbi:MAG: TonB-dependent receptor [Ignavibacteriaceae bacterium]
MCKIIFFTSIMVLIIFSIATTVLAASGNIEGYIKDVQTGETLPGANVFLKGTSLGAATDANGKYVIRNIPVGSYVIRISYVGYKFEEFTVVIKEGLTLRQNFNLKAVGVEGKAIVVTAQASGQNAAINQQLSSLQIKNVVSAAHLQELPDANAAESVGRLPGVSLVRSGGEGSEVVIRGLAPQYNEIMIDGVRMSSTDAGNRAVDLSMISSNMLGGIEVTKAITPDMDANVLGGVVNFKLREAKEGKNPGIELLAQGGYNGLQKSYSDYKFPLSFENRFLNNKLGVFAQVSIENRNLTSNELGASYSLNAPKLGVANPVNLNVLNLTDIPRDRHRYGATIVIDYKVPDMKIDFMNFVSESNTNSQSREESYSLTDNYHSYSATDLTNKLNVVTNLLDIEKNFPLFTVDAKFSHSYSENAIPDAITFGFQQNPVNLSDVSYQHLNPQNIPSLVKNDLSKTYFLSIDEYKSLSRERHLAGSLDFQSNINFSQDITSVLKFGGAYKYTIRSYNYDEGDGSLLYSDGNLVRQAILDAFPWMKKTVPDGNSQLPITLFADPNFSYGNFLAGDYQMGVPVNVGLMDQVMNVIRQHNTVGSYSYDHFTSATNDYSGNEYESAAYIMSTVNFGQDIIFLPGVRYQQLVTSYTAPRGVQTSVSKLEYIYRDTTIKETHGFWLPMALLIYKPLPWLQLHLSYTNSLSYPSFNAIVPRINIGIGNVQWNNFALKPANSSNYDVAISVYGNTIGLFTIDGFLKHINNLIFPESGFVINPQDYPGILSSTIGEPISTFINNPYVVDLWGVELDWQTHFWYLPGPLSGLVLSVNYTHIFSQAKYPRTTVITVYYPKFQKVISNSFYTNRLIDQPNDIANLAVGYDYKGFSTRVSMLLQSNVFEGDSFWPELRVNTAKYVRWDLSAKQDLPWFGLQLFFDINNINSATDININQGSNFPESEQYYGLTADLGFRWNL